MIWIQWLGEDLLAESLKRQTRLLLVIWVRLTLDRDPVQSESRVDTRACCGPRDSSRYVAPMTYCITGYLPRRQQWTAQITSVAGTCSTAISRAWPYSNAAAARLPRCAPGELLLVSLVSGPNQNCINPDPLACVRQATADGEVGRHMRPRRQADGCFRTDVFAS